MIRDKKARKFQLGFESQRFLNARTATRMRWGRHLCRVETRCKRAVRPKGEEKRYKSVRGSGDENDNKRIKNFYKCRQRVSSSLLQSRLCSIDALVFFFCLSRLLSLVFFVHDPRSLPRKNKQEYPLLLQPPPKKNKEATTDLSDATMSSSVVHSTVQRLQRWSEEKHDANRSASLELVRCTERYWGVLSHSEKTSSYSPLVLRESAFPRTVQCPDFASILAATAQKIDDLDASSGETLDRQALLRVVAGLADTKWGVAVHLLPLTLGSVVGRISDATAGTERALKDVFSSLYAQGVRGGDRTYVHLNVYTQSDRNSVGLKDKREALLALRFVESDEVPRYDRLLVDAADDPLRPPKRPVAMYLYSKRIVTEACLHIRERLAGCRKVYASCPAVHELLCRLSSVCDRVKENTGTYAVERYLSAPVQNTVGSRAATDSERGAAPSGSLSTPSPVSDAPRGCRSSLATAWLRVPDKFLLRLVEELRANEGCMSVSQLMVKLTGRLFDESCRLPSPLPFASSSSATSSPPSRALSPRPALASATATAPSKRDGAKERGVLALVRHFFNGFAVAVIFYLQEIEADGTGSSPPFLFEQDLEDESATTAKVGWSTDKSGRQKVRWTRSLTRLEELTGHSVEDEWLPKGVAVPSRRRVVRIGFPYQCHLFGGVRRGRGEFVEGTKPVFLCCPRRCASMDEVRDHARRDHGDENVLDEDSLAERFRRSGLSSVFDLEDELPLLRRLDLDTDDVERLRTLPDLHARVREAMKKIAKNDRILVEVKANVDDAACALDGLCREMARDRQADAEAAESDGRFQDAVRSLNLTLTLRLRFKVLATRVLLSRETLETRCAAWMVAIERKESIQEQFLKRKNSVQQAEQDVDRIWGAREQKYEAAREEMEGFDVGAIEKGGLANASSHDALRGYGSLLVQRFIDKAANIKSSLARDPGTATTLRATLAGSVRRRANRERGDKTNETDDDRVASNASAFDGRRAKKREDTRRGERQRDRNEEDGRKSIRKDEQKSETSIEDDSDRDQDEAVQDDGSIWEGGFFDIEGQGVTDRPTNGIESASLLLEEAEGDDDPVGRRANEQQETPSLVEDDSFFRPPATPAVERTRPRLAVASRREGDAKRVERSTPVLHLRGAPIPETATADPVRKRKRPVEMAWQMLDALPTRSVVEERRVDLKRTSGRQPGATRDARTRAVQFLPPQKRWRENRKDEEGIDDDDDEEEKEEDDHDDDDEDDECSRPRSSVELDLQEASKEYVADMQIMRGDQDWSERRVQSRIARALDPSLEERIRRYLKKWRIAKTARGGVDGGVDRDGNAVGGDGRPEHRVDAAPDFLLQDEIRRLCLPDSARASAAGASAAKAPTTTLQLVDPRTIRASVGELGECTAVALQMIGLLSDSGRPQGAAFASGVYHLLCYPFGLSATGGLRIAEAASAIVQDKRLTSTRALWSLFANIVEVCNSNGNGRLNALFRKRFSRTDDPFLAVAEIHPVEPYEGPEVDPRLFRLALEGDYELDDPRARSLEDDDDDDFDVDRQNEDCRDRAVAVDRRSRLVLRQARSWSARRGCDRWTKILGNANCGICRKKLREAPFGGWPCLALRRSLAELVDGADLSEAVPGGRALVATKNSEAAGGRSRGSFDDDGGDGRSTLRSDPTISERDLRCVGISNAELDMAKDDLAFGAVAELMCQLPGFHLFHVHCKRQRDEMHLVETALLFNVGASDRLREDLASRRVEFSSVASSCPTCLNPLRRFRASRSRDVGQSGDADHCRDLEAYVSKAAVAAELARRLADASTNNLLIEPYRVEEAVKRFQGSRCSRFRQGDAGEAGTAGNPRVVETSLSLLGMAYGSLGGVDATSTPIARRIDDDRQWRDATIRALEIRLHLCFQSSAGCSGSLRSLLPDEDDDRVSTGSYGTRPALTMAEVRAAPHLALEGDLEGRRRLARISLLDSRREVPFTLADLFGPSTSDGSPTSTTGATRAWSGLTARQAAVRMMFMEDPERRSFLALEGLSNDEVASSFSRSLVSPSSSKSAPSASPSSTSTEYRPMDRLSFFAPRNGSRPCDCGGCGACEYVYPRTESFAGESIDSVVDCGTRGVVFLVHCLNCPYRRLARTDGTLRSRICALVQRNTRNNHFAAEGHRVCVVGLAAYAEKRRGPILLAAWKEKLGLSGLCRSKAEA